MIYREVLVQGYWLRLLDVCFGPWWCSWSSLSSWFLCGVDVRGLSLFRELQWHVGFLMSHAGVKRPPRIADVPLYTILEYFVAPAYCKVQ